MAEGAKLGSFEKWWQTFKEQNYETQNNDDSRLDLTLYRRCSIQFCWKINELFSGDCSEQFYEVQQLILEKFSIDGLGLRKLG